MLLPQPVLPVGGSPPSLSGTAGAHLAGRGPSRVRSVAEVGLFPQPTLLVWLPRPPPLRPLLRLRMYRRVRCLLPPAGHSGAGGGRSERDRSAAGRDRSPRPSPLGLGSGSRSSLVAGPSRSGDGGRSSPSPSGAGDDDRSSTVDSLDLDQDDSFRAVLRLIREFHSLEEPASVAPNQCKTSLAPVFGLHSESSPALHLPTSSLLQSLLEDTNLALTKFVEDQIVHGFLPIPGRRHRRYYRTSSSFPSPYTVPPGLASITFKKVSKSRKRSISLSHSQVSSLETMISSVYEITSWLDWWLSGSI